MTENEEDIEEYEKGDKICKKHEIGLCGNIFGNFSEIFRDVKTYPKTKENRGKDDISKNEKNLQRGS